MRGKLMFLTTRFNLNRYNHLTVRIILNLLKFDELIIIIYRNSALQSTDII